MFFKLFNFVMRPACNVLSILIGVGHRKSKIVSNFAVKILRLILLVILFSSEKDIKSNWKSEIRSKTLE
jgi:hypothetical protein